MGDYTAKTDAKGRVFLPAPLRKVLEREGEERLVLRPDVFKPCLVLYPESLWNDILDKMRNRLNRWNARHQEILRQFVAVAEVVELDGNGRFLLNKRKMQYAGITADVVFLSVDDRIELWDKDRYESQLLPPEELGQMLSEVLGEESDG